MNEANVKIYIDYFRKHFYDVVSLNREQSDFKKILYFTIIDSLSKSIYPSDGNRERILNFLEIIVDWKNGQLFSLPHLFAFFKLLPEPQYFELKNFIIEKYKAMKTGWVYSIDEIDILYNDILKFNSTIINDIFDKKSKKSIYQFQHLNLFYTYRNSLIHEMKPLGSDNTRIKKQEIPHYLSHLEYQVEPDLVEGYWHLSYPETFLKNICRVSIIKTEEYLLRNDIDPYYKTNKGYFWIEGLNTI
ncbi:hypothetical protein [Leptospira sp. GIMC2001]|uniref:hypothetical protein n=1 Tax=Leptospira sp. GIMC2001 TaxID=1513297 RepID=UPI00234BC4CA|nr:hypothetical protein [Leptospira sp. GIMC2001]WCL51016.1 hypothetical protein O4O04_09450 [Leptospira sp. GIMC2001]